MRIAMIGQKGIPAISGGVERHVEEIGKRMVALGHDVTVYCRKHYNGTTENLYEGMRLNYIPAIKSKSLDAISHTFLSSIHSIFRDFDIIHYHAIGPASLSFIPRCFMKKVVVTVHGLDWMRAKWGRFAKIYLKSGERASAKFPNETIVVSKTLKKYYQEKYNRDVFYIPNGVGQAQLAEPLEIKKYGLEKNDYILFLARLTPEKGCHYLLDANKTLNTDKKLVIAGGSSHTCDYENELHKRKVGNVVFTGNVTGGLLRELYTNAYFYVLPSEIEGLPISLLEAMSFGKCCLVSNIPENLEVIEENRKELYGFSFENKDSEDLGKKINYLVENPGEVEKVGQLAKEMVLKNYNWDTVTSQTVSVYEKILEQEVADIKNHAGYK